MPSSTRSIWGANIDIARRKLGYRLSLESGAYSASANPGGPIEATFVVRNDGYAAPFNPRGLVLVLRHSSLGTTYVANLPDDPRRFAPGATTTVSRRFCLPTAMAEGSYALLLGLPDPVPALADRPEYAIRLANQNLWEAGTGYNSLNHTLTVTANATAASCGADDLALVQKN